MGARNRSQQNLEVVRTDPIRGLLFIKGSVPGHKGSWLTVSDAIKLPRPDTAPYPAGILEDLNLKDVEVPEAGLVDEAAVHEIPALPSDEEVAAIAAEQAAHVEEEQAAAEADAAEAADAKVEAEAREAEAKAKAIEAGKSEADESKEG
jgi:large subunit ribosomal protein L3